VPWLPDLFSAAALARISASPEAHAVPYFAGLLTGDPDPLIRSFAHEPELHHPIRGRVKGARAFERFVADTHRWLVERDATWAPVDLVQTERRGVEEVVLSHDEDAGRVDVPVAIAADRDASGRLTDLRVYFSTWPLTGHHAIRPPVLQLDPDVEERGVVGEYQRALAAGDAEGCVAAFEPDATVREPAGTAYVHRGHDELHSLYETFFSNGGGIGLEHCAATDDGRACALEYNAVSWGRTEMPPQAGIAVYVRGKSGRLAAARIYDDADPPLGEHA